MKILLVSDTGSAGAQARHWVQLSQQLVHWGHEVRLILPQAATRRTGWRWRASDDFRDRLADFVPDAVHIATAGPLGWAARQYALRHGWHFTTSLRWLGAWPPQTWRQRSLQHWLRRFHQPALRILVPTAQAAQDLAAAGWRTPCLVWRHGGSPWAPPLRVPAQIAALPRPVCVLMLAAADEAHWAAYLGMPLPGSKVVLGTRAQMARWRARFPEVHWFAAETPARLAACYAAADLGVFAGESVALSAAMQRCIASGTPVAARPTGSACGQTVGTGAWDRHLRDACLRTLALPRATLTPLPPAVDEQARARQFLDALCSVSTVQFRPS